MRVLVVLKTLAGGGAERLNLDLVRQFNRLGARASFFVMKQDGSLVAAAEEMGVPVTYGIGPTASFRRGFPLVMARLVKAARGADIILGGLEFDPTFAAYAAGRAAHRPVAGQVHIDVGHFLADFPSRLATRAARHVYPRLDAVICVSQPIVPALLAFGLQPERIRVIENGIDQQRVRQLAGERRERPADALRTIVAIGRLEEQKGFDLLIRAHAQVRAAGSDHSLTIVGEGSQRSHLEGLATSLGVSGSVSMPGFLPNPYPTLAAADLFCLPSRYEGGPLVLLESVALGTPCLATDCVGNVRKILADGAFGEIVPTESAEALAEAIWLHLQCPQTLRQKALAGSHALGTFSIENCATQYLEVFEAVLRGHR